MNEACVGTYIDTETKFDGVRNVGIKDGKIVKITKKEIKGKETINAKAGGGGCDVGVRSECAVGVVIPRIRVRSKEKNFNRRFTPLEITLISNGAGADRRGQGSKVRVLGSHLAPWTPDPSDPRPLRFLFHPR